MLSGGSKDVSFAAVLGEGPSFIGGGHGPWLPCQLVQMDGYCSYGGHKGKCMLIFLG